MKFLLLIQGSSSDTQGTFHSHTSCILSIMHQLRVHAPIPVGSPVFYPWISSSGFPNSTVALPWKYAWFTRYCDQRYGIYNTKLVSGGRDLSRGKKKAKVNFMTMPRGSGGVFALDWSIRLKYIWFNISIEKIRRFPKYYISNLLAN